MSEEEGRFVAEREGILEEVLAFVAQPRTQPLYPDDIASAFKTRGYPERLVISAVWRLIDICRLDLNKHLAIVVIPVG